MSSRTESGRAPSVRKAFSSSFPRPKVRGYQPLLLRNKDTDCEVVEVGRLALSAGDPPMSPEDSAGKT